MRKVRPKMGFQADAVLTADPVARKQLSDHEKWVWADEYGNFEALKSMTSVNGELMTMTGSSNPYPGKLGVIEEGAYADILIVDGNPLEDISVIGADQKWFDAAPREGIDTIRIIMKDGRIYKNTISTEKGSKSLAALQDSSSVLADGSAAPSNAAVYPELHFCFLYH